MCMLKNANSTELVRNLHCLYLDNGKRIRQ